MSGFESVWVRLNRLIGLLGFGQLLLLRFPRSFLTLLLGKFFSLQHAFSLLSFLKFRLFLCCLLLLLKPLLGSGRGLCPELLKFLLFFGHPLLSFLLFDHCVHLCLLHAADVGDERPVTDSRPEKIVLTDRRACDGRKVACRVSTVQNVALDAGLLHLALLAAGAQATLATGTLERTVFALILRLFHVAV